MRKLLFAILFFMTASIVLHARYGETLEQLEARFGKGSKPTVMSNDKYIADVIYSFGKNGINITAHMINGRCEKIIYNNQKGFSDEEITNLLELNKQNSLWVPLPEPRRMDGKKEPLPKKCWQSEDLKLYVEKYGSTSVVIFSKTYIEKAQQVEKKIKEEKDQKAAANKLEGF